MTKTQSGSELKKPKNPSHFNKTAKTNSVKSTPSDEVVEGLLEILSDSFVLYMKTFAVHWNYHGSNFLSVHKLTEAHYNEMTVAIDNIAERLRTMGVTTPISLAQIVRRSELSEMTSFNEASQSIDELVSGHEQLSKCARNLSKAMDEKGDVYSADMMANRSGFHDKAVWMLKSTLNDN